MTRPPPAQAPRQALPRPRGLVPECWPLHLHNVHCCEFRELPALCARAVRLSQVRVTAGPRVPLLPSCQANLGVTSYWWRLLVVACPCNFSKSAQEHVWSMCVYNRRLAKHLHFRITTCNYLGVANGRRPHCFEKPDTCNRGTSARCTCERRTVYTVCLRDTFEPLLHC